MLNRHSHGIVDALFAVFTKFFFGTRTSSGIPTGIRTISEWDAKIVEAYEGGEYEATVTRKLGLLAADRFFLDWLGFEKYGTPRKHR